MDKNEKTQHREGLAKSYPKQQDKSAKKRTDTQPPILSGAALSAFLKRYRFDLQSCDLTNEVSKIIDHVEQPLILVEGGSYAND